MKYLPPYYHPTQICCVDDNQRFLQRLTASMPADQTFRAFSTPESALNYVLQQNTQPTLADRCFERHDHSIQLNLTTIEHEIKQVQRFDRLSVVLVDYSMPTMDGLEFCAAIAHMDVRRVLLTSVANEKLAVAAFNDGLIHQYLPKAAITSPSAVVPYLLEQQQRYFQLYLRRITQALAARPPEFMESQAFIAFFQGVLAELAIVEYYLLTEPLGYLLLTARGETFHLIVRTELQHRADLDTMRCHNAPAELITAVSARQMMYVPYEHPQDYMGHETFPWEEFVFQAQQFQGSPDWLAAVISNPPTDVDFDATTCSHEQYLHPPKTRASA